MLSHWLEHWVKRQKLPTETPDVTGAIWAQGSADPLASKRIAQLLEAGLSRPHSGISYLVRAWDIGRSSRVTARAVDRFPRVFLCLRDGGLFERTVNRLATSARNPSNCLY